MAAVELHLGAEKDAGAVSGGELMVRYRDLPAVQFTPKPYRRVPGPEKVGDVLIGLDGIAYWSFLEGPTTLKIVSERGEQTILHAPDGDVFSFPLIQRFGDGRWLIVESRNATTSPNAFVVDSTGSLINSFYAGDGIQAVLVDRKNRIWIGYFDEGVFGAFDVAKDHPWHKFGPNGLVRVDTKGNIEFAYNRGRKDKLISDIYAMTIDDEDRLWFSPYTDFFLASVTDDEVQYVLPQSPRPLEMAIGVGRRYFSFFGGFRESSMVTLVERATSRLRLMQVLAEDGNTLSPVRIATRGTTAVLLAANSLYRLEQEELLTALGPWRDENTSTVDSAAQYQNEEAGYAGYRVIYGEGSDREVRQPRPRENPTRHDYDTGQGPL